MKQKILVVDDDPDILEVLECTLKGDYTVVTAQGGGEAVSLIHKNRPDLVILDLNLPDVSGLDVCRLVKKDKTTQALPVMMLTARGQTEDKVLGLETGADDYLTKPFEPKELLARVRSIFRRVDYSGSPEEVLERGPVRILVSSITVEINGEAKANLTRREFDLLYTLMKKSPQVLNRNALIETIWGNDVPVTNRTVDATIKRLRAKLGEPGATYIKTIEGFGYRFEA